jgi:CRP/FNR family transcriptional regulator, anaerobic regulatory protein
MSGDTLEYTSIFSSVFETDLIAELEAKSMLMQVSGGETIIRTGSPVRAVPLVISGVVKVSLINIEGQEILLYYVRKGETCAMSFTCWMTTQVSSVDGVAEEDSVLLAIPGKVVDEWLLKYPSWKKFVMTTILDGFTVVIKSIDDIAFKKMDDRLINYLKEKSKATGSTLINLTHQQIGDELGTNRVVVSRLLKKLENDNRLLLYRNQIKLLRDL